jgi:transposase
VVLEGTFGWGWICDELAAGGVAPHLTSGSKTKAWRIARGKTKSNRLDADLLSELWSQQPRWWEVWLAPPEVRQQREWLRHRMSLVQTQTQTKNRVQATLHRHGILHPYSDLFGKAGRQFLAQLAAADNAVLPPSARVGLADNLQILEVLRRQLARITRQLRQQVRQNPAAQIWDSLPGIGWILAHMIQAEIGDLARFANAHHLASYSLLAPRSQDSGDEDPNEVPRGRHVGHQGRRSLKWAFIQAAHSAVKKSGHFRAIFDRRTGGGKRDKNRGYITVAHALCVVGFACARQQRYYSETRPDRPGRKERLESRPYAGRPDPAMAAAAS